MNIYPSSLFFLDSSVVGEDKGGQAAAADAVTGCCGHSGRSPYSSKSSSEILVVTKCSLISIKSH